MRARRIAALAAAGLLVAVGAPACGGSASGSGAGARAEVSAASSLRTAFVDYGRRLGDPQPAFSFAGSDALAAQIRQGARPDVYAAADDVLPAQLHRDGLVDAPVIFATNELVVAVPSGSSRVRTLADLGRPGVTLAIGAPAVPVGAYTRTVLSRLPPGRRAAIEANVRSTEPDVAGIVGKLEQGAVDAGFVYRSDVRTSGGRLGAIALPPRLRPLVRYGVAVVRGAPHRAAAERFVAGLRAPAGRRALRAAGFGVPAP